MKASSMTKKVTIAEFVREVGPTVEPWEATTIDDVRRAASDLDVRWEDQEFTMDEVVDYAWRRCKERKAIYAKLKNGASRTNPEQTVDYYEDGDIYLEFPETWDNAEVSGVIDQIEAELEKAARRSAIYDKLEAGKALLFYRASH